MNELDIKTLPDRRTKMDLTGRTALITGGGGFLGPEHGAALVRWGAAAVLVDVDEAGLAAACKRLRHEFPDAHVESAVADITDEAALHKLRSDLDRRRLEIDILVNNAALNPKMDSLNGGSSGSVEAYDMNLWEQELKVGITGTFLCCRTFGARMAERGRGSIVNIASDLAILAPDQSIYAPSGRIEDVRHFKPIGYSVVKSAMLGLNRYLATYWGHQGVRVNCLVPGPVFNDQPEPLLGRIREKIPLRRWADKSEYQEALAFLASDASSYMTGQMLVMDGGRSIW